MHIILFPLIKLKKNKINSNRFSENLKNENSRVLEKFFSIVLTMMCGRKRNNLTKLLI